MIPTAEEFELVVLGGGPGGYAAALYGASAGMHVAMIEESRVGGTCLNRGCIPAKELLETATVLRTVAGAAEFGVTSRRSDRRPRRSARCASSRSSTASSAGSRRC